ncbi:MAG: hypothetical protein SH817_06870 [Leptospira sp.]|nr:hypothetical protein [Leptospira sp.]
MMSCFVFLFFSNCVSIKSNYLKLRYGSAIDEPIAPEKLRFPANDVRVFQKSPVWELAKAIFFYDFVKVKLLSDKYKSALDTPDPYLGNSLLIFSIRTENEEAVRILLESGANPNFKSPFSHRTPMQNAAKSTIRILRMVAEKGGDPNYGTEKSPSAMVEAHSLEHLKIMLSGSGDMHMKNEFGGSLLLSTYLLYDKLDIVLYLLHAGVDFRGKLAESVGNNYGKPREQKVSLFLVEELRFKTYPLESSEYKDKMQIVKFLQEHGIEYKYAPIPLATITEIDRIAVREGWSERRKKKYLEKY